MLNLDHSAIIGAYREALELRPIHQLIHSHREDETLATLGMPNDKRIRAYGLTAIYVTA